MNREILFKAKRKDNGEWVEGFLVRMFGTFCIQDSDDENIVYEIDPDTICRDTGLTDKNGKEIWENDILRGHKNDNDLARVVLREFNVIDVDTLETVDKVVGWHTEVIETDALSKCEPFCLPMPLTDFYIERSEHEVVYNVFDDLEVVK